MALGANPDDPTLDIKPPQGEPYYRLRVGDWRVIYDKDDDVKIIAIEKVKPRGGAYKLSNPLTAKTNMCFCLSIFIMRCAIRSMNA